jgi:hypothetical protein
VSEIVKKKTKMAEYHSIAGINCAPFYRRALRAGAHWHAQARFTGKF